MLKKYTYKRKMNKTTWGKHITSFFGVLILVLLCVVYLVSPINNLDANTTTADSEFACTVSQTPGFTLTDPTTAPTQALSTSTPTTYEIMPEFLPLLEKNDDIVGHIYIEDTNIDYYVFQGEDNEYYLSHNIDKESSKSGEIFLDYRCDIKDITGNIIIYGHNSSFSGTMFHELEKYKDQSFFEQHSIIEFDTLYQRFSWKIFSVYTVDADFPYIETAFASSKEWNHFLQTCLSQSVFESNIEISNEKVILTLSTCSHDFNDARLVVHARLLP